MSFICKPLLQFCKILNALLVVRVISLLLVHELAVSFLKICILEFPLETLVFRIRTLVLRVEFFLVSSHELHESFMPSLVKVDVSNDRVWNICQVKKEYDHVRLFMSDLLAALDHLTIVIQKVHLVILNELFSLLDEGTDVVEQC